ncbi:MAG: Citrate synthase 1 [Acidimicrobiales bacterium]|nr:MAG: citrate synthase/methylcitrate synthase [Actinomycetota bacterium]MBV6509899.1 Citrate synthase 1 [Acidimicrobiales bacterium]RIK03283.1 MAG: citrate synthase/methylcitrate synthase [Acidobacteriota bacterium]
MVTSSLATDPRDPYAAAGAGNDNHIAVPAGLRNVAVARTALGGVRGDEGFYHYRQYSAVELASKRSLEDTWHLLIEGHLPAREQAEGFARAVAADRVVPPEVLERLPAIASACPDTLSALRTSLSLTGAVLGLGPTHGAPPAQLLADARRVAAVTPTLVAALHRLRTGTEPIRPDAGLGHAADYLRMLTGKPSSPESVNAVERYLVSTIDHGFNASTFTARVIASTGTDIGSAILGALGALTGPLHGGAPALALSMLDDIGAADATAWVEAQVAGGRRIMGFGHAVYRTEDPRARLLRETALELGGERVERAVEIEEQILQALARLKPHRQIATNVEYWAAIVLDSCGLPRSLFTPTFACSRVIGWTAHILEQVSESTLIRPSAAYVGPPPPAPLP